MASVGVSSVKIADHDGDVATVTSNRLDVNVDSAGRGITASILSYAQFDAATSPTAISDATNGINASLTDCVEIIIQCDFDNTGYIMVGGSGAAADTNGIRLNAGDMLVLPVSYTANVYIDGSASSQKVNVSVRR
tara:strand:- start:140 stop:544 length:405 start_codon:yes stop_codon:yes gene_type:complete